MAATESSTACWPRPFSSFCPRFIPFSTGNGNAKLTVDWKCPGSPGSTPQRFVGLTTNHGPAEKQGPREEIQRPYFVIRNVNEVDSHIDRKLKGLEAAVRRMSALMTRTSGAGADSAFGITEGPTMTVAPTIAALAAAAYGRRGRPPCHGFWIDAHVSRPRRQIDAPVQQPEVCGDVLRVARLRA